jgi:S1-C subfamily serine protease
MPRSTYYGDSVLYGGFEDYASTVVASDQASDVAILKTDENPFRSPKVLRGTPTQKIMPKLGVARVNGDIPAAGTLTVLSGYPLNISVLVSQTGNVAGTGATPGPPIGEPLKAVRILVSVVSNGGNSGGPVLNDHGELIGLLEGNFLAPVVDPQTRSQLYGFVPKTDSSGNPIKDDKGNIQVTIVAPLTQNSGISMVIPARLIIPLLKQAAERK